MGDDHTTITIDKKTWRRINMAKDVGDSFDDVVNRLADAFEARPDIQMSPETVDRLRAVQDPDESIDETVDRLISFYESQHEANDNATATSS